MAKQLDPATPSKPKSARMLAWEADRERRKKESAEQRVRMKADRADARSRRPKAHNFEKDGEYLRVEFNRENGERVIGAYKRIGWARGPAEFEADIQRRLSSPPIAVLYPEAMAKRIGHPHPLAEQPGLPSEQTSDHRDPQSEGS